MQSRAKDALRTGAAVTTFGSALGVLMFFFGLWGVVGYVLFLVAWAVIAAIRELRADEGRAEPPPDIPGSPK